MEALKHRNKLNSTAGKSFYGPVDGEVDSHSRRCNFFVKMRNAGFWSPENTMMLEPTCIQSFFLRSSPFFLLVLIRHHHGQVVNFDSPLWGAY